MINDFLLKNGFALMLVFARMGATFMIFPGFSAIYVNVHVRLILALATTLLVEPTVIGILPPMPQTVGNLALMLGGEITVGVFIAMMAVFVMSALHVAGTSISRDTGLTNSSIVDPITEQQSSLVISLLSQIALLVIFETNMHHLMIRAALGSYQLFIPGHTLVFGDMANAMVDTLSRVAFIALQLCSPFLVFNIIFQTSLGLINRLAPQAAVSQISAPLQIFLGLAMLWAGMPAIIMWFMHYFQDVFVPLTTGQP